MFYLSKLLGSPVRDVENKSAGTLHDLVVTSRQAYPRVTALAVRRRGRVAPRPLGRRHELRGVRHPAAHPRVRAERARERARRAGPRRPPSSTSSWSTPRAARSSASTTSSCCATAQSVHVAAVDVSSNAILRRVGLAKVGERLAKGRQKPKPHLIDWKDVDVEQTDESRRAAHRAAHQAGAAAPGGHRRPCPRALARGARRGAGRPRGRAGRRHLRGAAPVLPGLAAARHAGREGQRDAQRHVAGRRRRPAGGPARRPPPALHRHDGEGRRGGHARAAQLPGALGRRHHDDRTSPGCAWRRPPAEALESLREQAEDVETVYYIYVRRPLRAPARRHLAARPVCSACRRTARSATS